MHPVRFLASLAALMILAAMTVTVLDVHPAAADTGGYPWASAKCAHTESASGSCANYDWYWDENGDGHYTDANHNGVFDDPELFDQWGYGYRNCTSWVAWRLSTNNGFPMPYDIGNANNWDNYFAAHSHAPDNQPAPGAIAQTDAGTFGHVAYVESVTPDGTHVTVSEYNHAGDGTYDTRTVPASEFRYIHVKDLPAGRYADGTFVRTADGKAWRVVGGSLLYVDNWATLGGAPASLPTVDPSLYAPYPADGTALDARPSGQGWDIIGGAPIIADNWNALGNPTVYAVNDGALDASTSYSFGHLRSMPADGTAVHGATTGAGYVFAGGAPLYVSAWANVGNPVSTAVNEGALDGTYGYSHGHLRQYPADGTAVFDDAPGPSHGAGYVFAGGAPLYVSAWANVGNPASSPIDGYALGNYSATGPLSHALPHPADGTAVFDGTPGPSHGAGYVFAGGAPLYVSSWANVGNPALVQIDGYALANYSPTGPLSHARAYPTDGTFLHTNTARSYRVVGAAAIPLSDCSVLGGCLGAVPVDQWPIDNPTDVRSHLRPVPADGTTLLGEPSAGAWSLVAGCRVSAAPGTGVAVNDSALTGLAACQPPVANAGPDEKIASGGKFALDATQSTDPQGQPLRFQWTQIGGPVATIDDRTKAQPTLTAPKGPATLTFRLQVNNAAGLSGSDDVVVTVQGPK